MASPSSAELASIASRIDTTPLEGKRVLVTGASGLIGSYLVGAILGSTRLNGGNAPYVDLLVRDKNGGNLRSFLTEPSVRVIECELTEWVPSEPYDYLIHAASPASPTKYGDPEEIFDANLGFLRNISKYELPKVCLLISSGEVYGPNAPVPIDETYRAEFIPSSSRSAYPLAKIAAEEFLLSLPVGSSSKLMVARLFHTFGPGLKRDDGRSFADFIWAAAQNCDIKMRSSGSAVRTFLYIEDAICGLLAVLLGGEDREVYNVGSPRETSIHEFATQVGLLGGVAVHVNSANVNELPYTNSPNHRIVPAVRKLEKLGWTINVDLQTGIDRTLRWAKNEL